MTEDSARGVRLFNGVNLDGWLHAGRGRFRVENGMLVTEGGLGLLWYSHRQFRDFELKVDWKASRRSDNSGIFVRFPRPDGDPSVAVDQGYEIQIDDEGAPDGDMIHKTGAIYNAEPPVKVASRPPKEWNTFVIRAVGQLYDVTLNGEPVIIEFHGSRCARGYIGLQNHSVTDQVFFRNVAVTLI